MTRTTAPARLTWLVDQLDPPPDARVLELGCGRGVAVDLLCPRLPRGHVVGLDRSASAIAAATSRNARWVEAGRASLVEGTVAAAAGLGLGTFDMVVAMNVNLFWTGPAEVECAALHEVLADGGVLHLAWETPGGERARHVAERAGAALEAGGFRHEVVRAPSSPSLLCLTARPA